MANLVCGDVLFCPTYSNVTSCKTKGQQVCCELNRIHNKVRMQSYVSWFDGNSSVQLSDVATYVTNSSGMSLPI
jgi:hypothetical protein